MDESEILKFEQQVRPLRLSEAIRIGSKIRPQIRVPNRENITSGSCALGAAYEAVTGKYNPTGDGRYVLTLFDISAALACRVASRNDAGQSRESIADWLESEGY